MTNSGHVAFQRDEESVCCELTILYRSFQERGSKLQREGMLEGEVATFAVCEVRCRGIYTRGPQASKQQARCSKRVPSPQDRLNRSFSRDSVDLSQEQGEEPEPFADSQASSLQETTLSRVLRTHSRSMYWWSATDCKCSMIAPWRRGNRPVDINSQGTQCQCWFG